jgi:hypothetical protein
VPTSVATTGYSACTAPCMTTIALSGNPNNTNSSPYYDYAKDILYVGADNGTLHKFTGVFNGTPTEVVAGGWPITVSTGNVLSSPVYDSVSGLVFVGSKRSTTGGMLHSVNAAGIVVSSAQLATNNTPGVSDAPIVDSSAARVYAFVASDNTLGCNTAPCMAVYQFQTNFAASAAGTRAQVGGGTAGTYVAYAGMFDNTYFTSANSASPTGALYVCGSDIGTPQRPALWKISITANAMGTPTQGQILVGSNASCSPVTSVMNGSNQYLYASVTTGGNATIATGGSTCTGACIYMYNLSGLAWGTGAKASNGLAAAGGTGGIIVDNISATAGSSQIYYSTLTSPGNAVQASQAGLQ